MTEKIDSNRDGLLCLLRIRKAADLNIVHAASGGKNMIAPKYYAARFGITINQAKRELQTFYANGILLRGGNGQYVIIKQKWEALIPPNAQVHGLGQSRATQR